MYCPSNLFQATHYLSRCQNLQGTHGHISEQGTNQGILLSLTVDVCACCWYKMCPLEDMGVDMAPGCSAVPWTWFRFEELHVTVTDNLEKATEAWICWGLRSKSGIITESFPCPQGALKKSPNSLAENPWDSFHLALNIWKFKIESKWIMKALCFQWKGTDSCTSYGRVTPAPVMEI